MIDEAAAATRGRLQLRQIDDAENKAGESRIINTDVGGG